MKKIMSICFISPRYPTEKNPVHTFIDQLICEIADNGIECNVISPYSITDRIVNKSELVPEIRERLTQKGNKFTIYSPRYISLSHSVLGIKTEKLTYKSFRSVVFKEYKRRNLNADAIYGHFIFPQGMCASDLGKKLGIPSFLGYGESSIAEYLDMDKAILSEKLNNLSGVIAVSNDNKRELLDTGFINKDIPIGVFPNAIDNDKFYKMDKAIIRKELGFNKDDFIVVFTGHFIHRKGSRRLSDAINSIDNVHSIFIGKGEEEPDCKNILFKGTLPHDQVCKYLNAADVFVLPTLAEGCCNAIIEAMACGLPIVSSDKPFNDDILNKLNSIRINSCSVDEIIEAVQYLKDNPEARKKMSYASSEKAGTLRIEKRAKRIIEFIQVYGNKSVI